VVVIGALVILPTPPTLLLFSACVIVGGLLLFGTMARLGRIRVRYPPVS
jgi:hypothetical protein